MLYTILGTGDVEGHPIITKPNDFVDQGENKLRPGLLVQSLSTTLIFDTSPDIRMQLIRTGVTNINAIFITHQHFDHLWGIADVFQLSWLEKINFKVFLNKDTHQYIKKYFPWIKLPFEVFQYNKTYTFDDISVTPFKAIHSSNFETASFLINSENNKKVLYAPDWKGFQEKSTLQCDIAVIDGCYFFGKYITDNDEHLKGNELKSLIDKLQANKNYLMSVAPYYYQKTTRELRRQLPQNYILPDDFDSFEV